MSRDNSLTREYDEKTITGDYSRVTFIYDFWAGLTEKKAQKQVLEFADISDGTSVLEVAVGTGLLFKKIVEKNPNGQNIGIDLSSDMLGKAKGRMLKSDLNNYELKIGNALKLPFGDNTFDLIVNNFMLDLLPEEDFSPIIHEFHRVLKPSGKVVISTMAFGTKRVHHFWGWLAKHFPRLLAGCRPITVVNQLNEEFNEVQVSQVSQNTFPAEISLAISI